MGMYDNVDFAGACPACGQECLPWQTKEREEPCLDTLPWTEVNKFHTYCSESRLHGDTGCGTYSSYEYKGSDSVRVIEDYDLRLERHQHEGQLPRHAFCWDRAMRRLYGIRVKMLRYAGTATLVTLRRDWLDRRSWRPRSKINVVIRLIEKAGPVWWAYPIHWSVFSPFSRTFVLECDVPIIPPELLAEAGLQ